LDSGDVASSFGGLDPLMLGGGVALVALLGIGAAVLGNKGTETESSSTEKVKKVEPKPEPIDVSIPYDAAALLAYQKANLRGKETDKGFQEFKVMYKELAVAEVILKREQQKILDMEAKVKEMQSKIVEKYPSAVTNGSAKKVEVEA
jgi:hypothetical protein